MAKVVIDQFGDKIYSNDNGDRHREDGPAIIWESGTKLWYVNGIQSSTTHPCDEYDDGRKIWFVDDEYHRENGPTWELPNGEKMWYRKGKQIWPEL